MPHTRLLTPEEVRAYAGCPTCRASRGENCRRQRFHKLHGWVRYANHRSRIVAAGRVTTN